jgi:hypothetical protein
MRSLTRVPLDACRHISNIEVELIPLENYSANTKGDLRLRNILRGGGGVIFGDGNHDSQDAVVGTTL